MANEKRLIDANAYIDELKWLQANVNSASAIEIQEYIDRANRQPTVDAVEVVHGRWEKEEPDKCGNRKPKCSVCGKYHLAWWSDYTHCNYCPNCGAKMDGDGNG